MPWCVGRGFWCSGNVKRNCLEETVDVPAVDIAEGEFMEMQDELPRVVARFTIQKQKVCIPTLA